jgi:pimeloyl-ACP methyl ester carboxylesterase
VSGAQDIARFAAPDGRSIAWRDSGGDGPPVLCLAGLTRNGRDFDSVAALLAPRFRVIRMDARGRGASAHAADPAAEYTVPVEAGDALALLGHLGIGRVAVVGTSRGGILGMAMAGAVPGLVSALVLNDVGAVIEGAGLLNIVERLGQTIAAEDFDAAARILAERNAAQFPGVPLARWRAHAQAIFDAVDGRLVPAFDPRLGDAVSAGLDREQTEIDLWPLFAGLDKTPTLVIRGALSDLLSAETVARMCASEIPVTAVEIPDRGHAPFLDEPQAVAALVPFLETHAR